MARLIVILGATGKQGGSVAEAFLKDPAYKVRAVARNPHSEAGETLSAQGAEVLKADLSDVEGLTRAFEGANVVYGMTTDFWSIVCSSETPPVGKGVLEWANDIEIQQGLNIITAILPIVNSTLETFILSSLSATRRISGGKYTSVYHFDAKAATVDTIKEDYPELAKKTAVLQLGLMATNWKGPTPIRPTKQADGTWEIGACGSPDALHPMVDPNRDPATFVRALAALPPRGALQTYLGFGSMMSFSTWAALWGKQNNVHAYYKELTVEEHNERISWLPGLGKELGEMYAYSAEFGYDGSEPGVIRMVDLDLVRPVTTMEEYLQNEDFSPLFGPDAMKVGRI